MLSNKMMNWIVVIFLLYIIGNEYYQKNGGIIPKIPVSKEILETKDNSFISKVIKTVGVAYDEKNLCGLDVKKFLEMPKISTLFKIYDLGSSDVALKCNETVNFSYKIYDLRGKILLESSKNIVLGAKDVPFAIHKALVYASRNSSMTIITPSSYLSKKIALEPVEKFYPKPLSLIDEMIIIELSVS